MEKATVVRSSSNVKIVGSESGREVLNTLVSKQHRSLGGVGFLQSDQLYSVFSATLTFQSFCRKGVGCEVFLNVSISLSALE